MTVSAYTAVVLLCRKLLMNVAVQEGADPNLKFIQYVDYLEAQHHFPARAKPWVDHIRAVGNTATHEIPAMGETDAQNLIRFSALLLKTIYEFPAAVAAPATGP